MHQIFQQLGFEIREEKEDYPLVMSILPLRSEEWYINLFRYLQKNGYNLEIAKDNSTKVYLIFKKYRDGEVYVDVGFETYFVNGMDLESYNTWPIDFKGFLDIFKSDIRDIKIDSITKKHEQ